MGAASWLPPGVHEGLRGRPFFPALPNKKPAAYLLPKDVDGTGTWKPFQERLPTPEEIAAWKDHRGPWAMPCGPISGFVVLDFDGEDGRRFFEARYDEAVLPPTSMTPKGGYHAFHAVPSNGAGETIKNAVQLLPGVDVRTRGGYVIVPSGYEDGRRWIATPDKVATPLPDWFLAAVKAPAPVPGTQEHDGLPAGVGQGQRNATAARLSGRYIAKGLGPEEVFQILRAWGAKCSPPLPEAELRAVIFSIARKEREKAFPLEVIGAAELVQARFEAREMLVKPFLPASGKGILAGNSGTGKTLLAENISYSVANEIPLFGRFDVSRGNVLYVDSESTQELARVRIAKIRNGLRVAHAGVSFIFPSRRLDLGVQRNREDLCRKIEHGKAALCILDSFLCFASLRNENDNAEVRGFLENLSDIPKATGAALLILDHAAKASPERARAGIGVTARGAGAKHDWADVVLTFEERKNELKILRTLRFAKTRFCSPVPAMILEMDSNLVFHPSGEDELCPGFTVRQAVEDNPGIAATKLYQLLMSLTGCSRPTADKAARMAAELGSIRRVERSKYVNYYPVVIGKTGDFPNVEETENEH